MMRAVPGGIPEFKAEFFRALGHPLRILALEALCDGERSVAELLAQLGVEQSHLSQQLGVLRRAGLVVSRREGTSVVYALADPRVAQILGISKQILLDMLSATHAELGAS